MEKCNTMKKPKGILFDLGDTILHELRYEPQKGNQYLFSIIDDKKGVRYERVLDRIGQLNEEIEPKKNTACFEFSWIAFNKLVFEYFNLSLPISHEEAELEFWKKSGNWVPAPKIRETLEFICQMNIPIGIVSNSVFSGKMLENELKRHNLLHYFRFVMASSDYGLRKPHPFLFELAASKLNAATSEVWFVGDTIECDIEGSRKTGMTPFHYIGKIKESPLPQTEVIRNWDELITMLSTFGIK